MDNLIGRADAVIGFLGSRHPRPAGVDWLSGFRLARFFHLGALKNRPSW